MIEVSIRRESVNRQGPFERREDRQEECENLEDCLALLYFFQSPSTKFLRSWKFSLDRNAQWQIYCKVALVQNSSTVRFFHKTGGACRALARLHSKKLRWEKQVLYHILSFHKFALHTLTLGLRSVLSKNLREIYYSGHHLLTGAPVPSSRKYQR